MKNKGLIGLIAVVLVVGVVIGGCTVNKTADMEQSMQTQRLMSDINSQIGMPNIKNFYEKKTLKEIYELRDRSDLITYTYTKAMNGKYIYEFKSIGYGIPMSVQYSNPEAYTGVIAKKVVNDGGRDFEYTYDKMPQPEPNGLFMPDSLSATWIIRVNDDGTREPVYMEPNIVVVQTKIDRRKCEDWSLPDNY